MRRTLSVAVMFAVLMAQMSILSAGSAAGIISGTMRGPAGPMSGVRVNALNTMGSIVGSAMTNGAGMYSLEGLPAGTFMVQAVSTSGAVMTTSTATLSAASMKSTTNLMASAAAAPAAQSVAVQSTSYNTKALWWIVGASAAAAGIIGAVAVDDDASPSR
jgi:Carboxypeptidase regulatory-like domain